MFINILLHPCLAKNDLVLFYKKHRQQQGRQMNSFGSACRNGKLEVAQRILMVNPVMNVSESDFAFSSACHGGHLEVAQWLLSIKPTIDVSADEELAFCLACYGGHLKVAQWLLSINPTIDVSADDDSAFCMACLFGHLEVARWLLSIKPSIDVSVVDERYISIPSIEVTQWLRSMKHPPPPLFPKLVCCCNAQIYY